MKNKSRIISILLAMLMVLSSFGAVFAEGEEAPQAPAGDTELTDELTQDETVPEEVTEPETGESESDEAVIPDGEGDTAGTADGDAALIPDGTDDVELNSDSSAAPVADANAEGTEVEITIHCRYQAEGKKATKDFSTKTRKVTVGSTQKAPDLACSADPSPATFVVEDGKTEYTIYYKPTAPKKVTGLKLHPSYKSIILTWDNVLGADKYKIYRSKDNKTFTLYKTVDDTTAKTQKFTDVNAKGTEGDFNVARKYYYKVAAVNVALSKNYISAKTSSLGNTCVRPMYEQVTFKASAQLTSHDKFKKTVTFKGGQTIIAQGFGGGKYKFYYKGCYFYANYVRVYKCKPLYQKNTDGTVSPTASKLVKYKYPTWKKQDYAQNGLTSYNKIRYYDKTTAEGFVNRSGKTSSTQYLIWVSTYTQHIYVFKGSKGKWKLYKDWECSTGAAGSPTPTGFDKKIVDKWYNHSGINYWNPFQNANSIHGHRLSYVFGKPQSNGCVRNYDPNAKWIYDNCKVGTGLIVY